MARHKFSEASVQTAKELVDKIVQTMKKRGMTELEPGPYGGETTLGYEKKLPGIGLLPLAPFYGKFMHTYSLMFVKLVGDRLVYNIKKHSVTYKWGSIFKEECYNACKTYRDYEFDELLELLYCHVLTKSKNKDVRMESEFYELLYRAENADPEQDAIEAAKLPKRTKEEWDAIFDAMEKAERSKRGYKFL